MGRAEFLTLIDDFRAVLGYEIEYEAQRADHLVALARLEPLTGASLVAPSAKDVALVRGDSHE